LYQDASRIRASALLGWTQYGAAAKELHEAIVLSNVETNGKAPITQSTSPQEIISLALQNNVSHKSKNKETSNLFTSTGLKSQEQPES
jgi:hypothetical protein